ncbi:hypothetical protein HLB44_31565 [Aquincola sp. S2]|uniref:TfuA-like core domain-containing protein n=1 Tax=Pseudaquabacterium terrae TaxID=2732868 RepID=A0ABX2ESA0_9BURK|nr:TfuA-like protein [Aquabacterium terrae]NRF71536.1 hypothetical protein [Aquabacterium terrae]
MAGDSVTLFAGPSAYGVPRAMLGERTQLLPPVQRGDIDRLLATAEEPGVIVVCDGVFQIAPAVSHAELCNAIDRGWAVWGVSSIGAIRAFEMRNEGMRGFGYVHSLFGSFDDFTDDEMCLLHAPEEPYFPVSEALVNLRYALERTRSSSGITPEAERTLISALRALWFGDRTIEKMRGVMVDEARIDVQSADRLLAWLQRYRVKTLDLIELMTQRPWASPQAR